MGEHPRGKILQRDPQGGDAETVNSSRHPAGVGPARVQVVPLQSRSQQVAASLLTSALQAPGNKVSGRWSPQRSREAGQSSRPRLRCCQRLPGRGGETSHSPRAGKKPRAGASRPSPPCPQPCHRDPQPGLTATPSRLPSRPPMGSGTPNSGRHPRPGGRLYLLSGRR